MTLMVWKDYRDRGMKSEAEDFARRTLPPDLYSDLPGLLKHKVLAEGMRSFDTLINAYKTMNLDYVNFHWYEPIIQRTTQRNQTNLNIEKADTKALGEVVAFLRRRT